MGVSYMNLSWFATINPNWIAAIVGIVVAFLLTPTVRVLATRMGVVAQPGGRRVHTRATPMLGGLAIFGGFFVALIAAMIFDALVRHRGLILESQHTGILVGGAFMAVIGIIDDKYELPGWAQALSILVGGGILVLFGVRIAWFTNPFKGGVPQPLGWYFGIPLTFVWVLMVTKAVDCMDGLDGLAAGISAIAAATLMAMAIASGYRFGMYAAMSAALLGACIGFLRYNYPPAKIFMGTVGAQFLGFTLAGISIAGAFKIATLVALAAPVLLMGVPLLDTSFVVFRRVMTGRKIHEADTTHLHHRLVNKGLSHRQVIWFIYALTGATCALSYLLFIYAK